MFFSLLACVATLPCEALMSENRQLTINYQVVWLRVKSMLGLLLTKLRKAYSESVSKLFLNQ